MPPGGVIPGVGAFPGMAAAAAAVPAASGFSAAPAGTLDTLCSLHVYKVMMPQHTFLLLACNKVSLCNADFRDFDCILLTAPHMYQDVACGVQVRL